MGFKAVVITISDRGSRGERKDTSGPEIVGMLQQIGMEIIGLQIIPDEKELIRRSLIEWSDVEKTDLILTTGGTGVSPRDVTPDATREVIDREIPGMAEAMRLESLQRTPFAMLSRAVVGARGRTLIINLPGSPKAALENFQTAKPVLEHAVKLLKDYPDSEQGHLVTK